MLIEGRHIFVLATTRVRCGMEAVNAKQSWLGDGGSEEGHFMTLFLTSEIQRIKISRMQTYPSDSPPSATRKHNFFSIFF